MCFKIKILTSFFAISILFSCSNSLLDAGRHGNDNENPDSSRFKYLACMYDYETGLYLNDNALSGEAFSRHKSDIQEVLNRKLKFPLSASYDGNWWESIPVYMGVNDKKLDDISVMTERLYDFFSSGNNCDIIEAYLDDYINRLDYLKASAEEGIKGDALYDLVPVVNNLHLYGNLFNLFQNFIFNITDESLINKNNIIKIYLGDYFSHLEAIEEEINNALFTGYAKEELNYYSDASSGAKSILISHLQSSQSQNIDLLYENFTRAAFQSRIEKNEGSLPERFIVPLIKVTTYASKSPYAENEIYDEKFFYINSPMEIISLKDIYLLKRMSLLRLLLIENVYTGRELLNHRGEIARKDLEVLLKIKNSFNNIYNEIAEDIYSFASMPELPGPEEKVLSYVCENDLSELRLVHSNVRPGGDEFPREDGYFFVSLERFNSELKSSLESIVYNNHDKIKQFVIITAAEISEWEIIVRAHIKASE